ncbi:MAG TPA: glycine cleavage system aminomethyltransferase GcvT [Methylocella sp.]|nr:glycine cleavage system aminomethyltransferase GcvT [Methylocella sp.]
MSDQAFATHSDASHELARSPLDDLHRAMGARMVGFAGHAMPLNYASGIISEHLHTRAQAGLFDVSHMGQAILEGPSAGRALERLVPGDIVGLLADRMRYTQFLDEEGHILDDLMVSRRMDENGVERLFLVVNAATKAADFARLAADLTASSLSILSGHALLALQGPAAVAVLRRQFPSSDAERLATQPFMSASSLDWKGLSLYITRSGYTGEDGFEISLPAFAAIDFAEALLADPAVRLIGLGARDTLRLEAGLCLYGHDIDRSTDPVEAGLLWSIPKRRRTEGGFLGFAALTKSIETGPVRRRVGILLEGKAPAREGDAIASLGGGVIGRLTSGGFAPSLGRPIAMGYVDTSHAVPGTKISLLSRGRALAATITRLPFVPHHYFRGIA